MEDITKYNNTNSRVDNTSNTKENCAKWVHRPHVCHQTNHGEAL